MTIDFISCKLRIISFERQVGPADVKGETRARRLAFLPDQLVSTPFENEPEINTAFAAIRRAAKKYANQTKFTDKISNVERKIPLHPLTSLYETVDGLNCRGLRRPGHSIKDAAQHPSIRAGSRTIAIGAPRPQQPLQQYSYKLNSPCFSGSQNVASSARAATMKTAVGVLSKLRSPTRKRREGEGEVCGYRALARTRTLINAYAYALRRRVTGGKILARIEIMAVKGREERRNEERGWEHKQHRTHAQLARAGERGREGGRE